MLMGCDLCSYEMVLMTVLYMDSHFDNLSQLEHTISGMVTSAPATTNTTTVETCPLFAAHNRGVCPFCIYTVYSDIFLYTCYCEHNASYAAYCQIISI